MGRGYRSLGRQALASILRKRMGQAIEEHLGRAIASAWSESLSIGD